MFKISAFENLKKKDIILSRLWKKEEVLEALADVSKVGSEKLSGTCND